ncbi:MAG: hypothetical protein P1Q69_00515 [Candidatus Thorarchaeota archaeon]|nr:hypothetical protein [Candidatus Thorarchaeota archaeon]
MGEEGSQQSIPSSRKVAIVANMTALALLGNYALVGIPNVELGSVVIFITALVFGLPMGIWTSLLTSIIFSTINPWGPFIPQIWFTQMIGWLYIAMVGGLLGRRKLNTYQKPIEMFVVGAFLAAVFDLVTNIGYSLVYNVPYAVAVVLGLPFMVIHVVSNAFILAFVVPIVEPIIKKNMASMIWNTPNEELYIAKDQESGEEM